MARAQIVFSPNLSLTNNEVDILELAFIETDGNIFIYKDGGFDGGLWNSVNQGWDGISVTYHVG